MPQFNISSTEIREGLKGGDELTDSLAPEVAAYIKKSGFWRADPTILIEQAREHYRHERWGEAVNRLNRALDIEPNNIEARELLTLVQEILKFRYTDIYNP